MPDYSASKLLQFLIDVLDEARHAPAAEANVIPVVVVDDLATMLPMITEVCRYAGHPIRVAEQLAEGLPIATRSTINPALRSAVEDISVDPTASGTPVHLSVVSDKGLLRVRVGSIANAPTNPGDRNQLGLLTALLDPSLSEASLAVLVFDETEIAEDTRMRLWTLLMDTLPAAGAMTSTLLVLIGTARIDYARHCRKGAGIRWAFSGGAIWRRQRWQSDSTQVARIAADAEPLIFMLGAGLSVSSDLPTGNQLRDVALARQVPDLAADGRGYEEQAREFFRQVVENRRLMAQEEGWSEAEFVKNLTLERVLREEAHLYTEGTLPTLQDFADRQRAAIAKPGPAIRDLRRLLHLRNRLVLMTVNFDQLIEDGARVLGPTDPDPYAEHPASPGDPPAVRLFVDDADLEAFVKFYPGYRDHGGPVPLLKLHGTIDRPHTVRANVDVTLPGLSEAASAALRSLVPPPGSNTNWTYVGCSMRDPDITVLSTRETSPNAA